MEVAAGKVKSKPVTLENGMADVVQWTLLQQLQTNLMYYDLLRMGSKIAFRCKSKQVSK